MSKTFGNKKVLDKLSFSITKGKITFIVGKSGEGKSVTIKHIIGLLKPDSGDIKIEGESIIKYEGQDLLEHRKRFGMLFQHAALFDSLSVQDNILFPLREHSNLTQKTMNRLADEVTMQVGLKNIMNKFPAEISTGEKKRVGLARALISKPHMLLYDEPTTGMDPLICEIIDKLIIDLSRNSNNKLTSIVISHDLKAALDTADEIIMIYQGKVALKASPQEFRKTNNPIVRQFFSGHLEGPMKFM